MYAGLIHHVGEIRLTVQNFDSTAFDNLARYYCLVIPLCTRSLSDVCPLVPSVGEGDRTDRSAGYANENAGRTNHEIALKAEGRYKAE